MKIKDSPSSLKAGMVYKTMGNRRHLKRIAVVVVILLITALLTGAVVSRFTQPVSLSRDILAVSLASSDKSFRQEVDIRVLLMSHVRIRLACSKGSLVILNRLKSREYAKLSAGTSGWLSCSNGTWSMQNEQGLELLPKLSCETLEIEPTKGAIILVGPGRLNGYRGKLRMMQGKNGRINVVNVVNIERYLNGVVGAEAYSNWHMAALRAQAIASRTYALYEMAKRSSKQWDIGNSQASQMYLGIARENKRVSRAVAETRGIVATYGKNGREKIFPTYYSSNCGGHTQNAEPVFGVKLPPLSGRKCPYCKRTAQSEKYRWNAITIEKWQVSDLLHKRYPDLAGLGNIIDVKITQKSEYGRAERIRLIGETKKSIIIRAEDFRLAVSSSKKPLLSSWYQLIDNGQSWTFAGGHGWGHGVGLCQWGSQAMAKAGNDCVEILEYYYPQLTLLRAY